MSVQEEKWKILTCTFIVKCLKKSLLGLWETNLPTFQNKALSKSLINPKKSWYFLHIRMMTLSPWEELSWNLFNKVTTFTLLTWLQELAEFPIMMLKSIFTSLRIFLTQKCSKNKKTKTLPNSIKTLRIKQNVRKSSLTILRSKKRTKIFWNLSLWLKDPFEAVRLKFQSGIWVFYPTTFAT